MLIVVSFIQRRSSDGFVSATGMFKAAFPWARHSEEQLEKDYLKGLPSTAQDEVAGNVWISEHYGILEHDIIKCHEANVTQPLNLLMNTESSAGLRPC